MSRTAAAKSKARLAAVPAANPAVVDSPSPPPSPITVVPLRLLRRAPENVRHIRPDEDVAPLADDIAHHGVLQSLIGYLAPDETGADRCWIAGGGRRLQALGLLLDRGALGLDFPVSVLIRDREDAIDLSLSENLSKRDMSPVDEFHAFAQLMARGNTSPRELAKRHGFGERYVRQRLRLAELAPGILDALAERRITLPAAEAYARASDHHLQMDVFKAQEKTGWDAHSPHRIRAAYQALQETTASPLYRFVGAESYERAGGGYEDDLFVGDERAGEHRKLSHGHLLLAKAAEMVALQTIRLEPELREELPGLAGFVVPPNARSGGYPWKAPAAPRGTVLVEADSRVDRKQLWKNARACGAAVTLIAGVAASGEIEVLRNRFFVEKGLAGRVRPASSHAGAQPETADQRAAREREAAIDRLQWRLAVPAFAGTPFEGRAFWPTYPPRLVETHDDHPGGRLVAVQMFVTDADHDAVRAAAEREHDERQAAKAAREEAQRRRDDLARMDPPPEVITVGGHPYFRKADGEWCDDPAAIADGDVLGEFSGIASLLDHFDHDEPIDHFRSIEAYRASLPAGGEVA